MFIVAVALLIGGSALLRASSFDPEADGPAGALVPDRDMLWRLPADALLTPEGLTPIDPAGLRAGPRGDAKGPRILLLGDEEFFGAGRALDATLAGQLAARLEEADAQAEILNSAVPGYSLLQTQAWLHAAGWSMEPELLLLAPGLSDCAPGPAQDAALMACLESPWQRLRWAWGPPESARALPQLAWGGEPELDALGCEAEQTQHRVPPAPFAEALDALLLDAAKRDVGVVILLSDTARGADCPHLDLIQRVSTRRAVPVMKLSEVNRSAGAWGRGARASDGQPSQDAVTAAAQALVDLLLQSGWPAHRLTPEIAAPPYSQGAAP